jgi:hypothetical protein
MGDRTVAFKYMMTDTCKDRLQLRVDEAIGRGFKPRGEMKRMGHKPIVIYGIKKHSMTHTAGKYGIEMGRA